MPRPCRFIGSQRERVYRCGTDRARPITVDGVAQPPSAVPCSDRITAEGGCATHAEREKDPGFRQDPSASTGSRVCRENYSSETSSVETSVTAELLLGRVVAPLAASTSSASSISSETSATLGWVDGSSTTASDSST